MLITDIKPPAILTRPFSLDTLEHTVLRDSVLEHGLLAPILVCPDGTIVDGLRRWMTCRGLGWAEIAASVVHGDPRRLRVIAQTPTLSDQEKGQILARSLTDDPSLSAAQLAHTYHWHPFEVDQLVGKPFLSPRAVSDYEDGRIPLASVWHLAKLKHEAQDRLLDAPDRSLLLEEARTAARESRSDRRRRIVSRDRGRSMTAIVRELETPTAAGPFLIAARAATPFDGWVAALQWASGKK